MNPDKEDLLETTLNAVDEAGIDRDSIRFIYLFGSYTTTPDTARDIDICISLAVDNPEQAGYKLKGRIPEEIDISVFETLPLQIKVQVFKGNLLYRNGDDVYDIAYQTFQDFNTFEPLYRTAIGADQ